jgi:uncharacterized protein YdhG (YjbR/CyaY superfamily)
MISIKFNSIDEYLAHQSEAARKKLFELRELIHEVVPDTEELMNYNIPAFTLIKCGKRDHQVMIAGYKTHVGFYPHPDTIKHFKSELKKYKSGKGSVQFPINDDIPKELIKKMIRYRKKMLAAI